MNRSAVVFFALFGFALGGAIIGNGKVILGVDNLGQLNIPYKAVTFADGGVPLPASDPTSVRVVGLRYDEYPFPPSTEPGCVCEGWGAKYVVNGASTYKAGVDNAAGVFGASLVSFSGTDGANIATSVVSLTGGAKVTHVFRTSPNPQIYRVVITIENPSTVPYTSFIYRRQMDWDIWPTQFNEFVTVRGAAGHPKLVSSCDDGFVGGDIDRRSCISVSGYKTNFEWAGPSDHGAFFDFEVGPIAAGKSVTFTMYYGVGPNYASVDAAINSLPLEVLSYGASNSGGRPNLSSWVFAWGFSGTGGDTITKPPFTVVAPDDYTVECGSAIVRDAPTYFGNCDDQPLTSLTSSETTTAGTCANNYVITRTFTGTDRCGKTSTVSQKITVRDITAPVITAPATAVYECGSTPTVSATASDTCSTATLTFVDTVTSPATCVGTGFNRVFTARDACGNTATATTVVTARDTTAPTLSVPANVEVDCSGSTLPASTGTATATDSCSTATVTYSDAVSGSGCPRTITRTWTAVDRCGNTVSGAQTITVRPFCGDGVAQGAEQCDLGETLNGAYGSCCTSTCTFAATSVACRVSAGLCDIVEYCTGSASACPSDTVKPNGTPCGEFFGMCDVSLEKSCTGTSPRCAGPPAFPGFPEVNASWTDYNVISFNQFQVSGGDVEGRLAVKNKATLASFTLGLELRLETDSWRKHSLFVAGDASWSEGSLHPDGTNVGAAGPAASAYVGGSAAFPAYLASRLDAAVPFTAATAMSSFDTLKAYYQGIQSQLSSIPTNVVASVQYTNGLLLTCTETSDFYHVTIPASVFSSTHWTELRNCKFTAAWVVDITGNDEVVIQGQPFPAIVERVIYNVLGTNTVRGATGVAGNILAPNSNYDMPSGVTYGVLVAGNVTFARQNNKPNCLVYNPVTLATKTSKPIKVGDSTIWMVSLPSFIAGDRVCVNGDCKKVIGGESRDIDGDGVVDHGIVVDTVFAVSHPADSFATAVVENPAASDRSAPLPEITGGEQNNNNSNSAATLTISLALFAILALFF